MISGGESSGTRAQECGLSFFDGGTCALIISDGGATGDGSLCSIVDGSSKNLTDPLLENWELCRWFDRGCFFRCASTPIRFCSIIDGSSANLTEIFLTIGNCVGHLTGGCSEARVTPVRFE